MTDKATQYAANARGILENIEEASPEEQLGAVRHAMNELEYARRELVEETENGSEEDTA